MNTKEKITLVTIVAKENVKLAETRSESKSYTCAVVDVKVSLKITFYDIPQGFVN